MATAACIFLAFSASRGEVRAAEPVVMPPPAFTALDKTTGAKLGEFMTDAGVNTTVTTFEHKARQYVVVHAGGGSVANGKRGDGIWMFSLDGKTGPIVAGAGEGAGAWPGWRGSRRHGGGPTLIGKLDAGQVRPIATTGRNNMPTLKEVYDANQIRDVSEYITTILPKGAGAAK